MKINRFLRISLLAAFIISVILIFPASADLEPDFDWEIYTVNTDDWSDYDDYDEYDGVIYEIHFTDETSGAVSWSWEFGEDDWWGSTKENPVKIITEEDADDSSYTMTVKLTVYDSSGVPYETSKTIFYGADDPWNLKTVYTLTPEPTATPTPIPTATPTPAPTVAPTPTPEPTPVASHTFQIAGISKEMTKLQDSFEDYITIIKAFLEKLGIST